MALTSGTCRLCLEQKELLQRSHVIPDFMYESLYDDKHKINMFAPAEYVAGNKKIQRPSTGEYEPGILCQHCDNVVINQYETYGKRALFAKVNEASEDLTERGTQIHNGVHILQFGNANYGQFKLFLLSILWRASVSKRHFFREVQLGPYEEEIRSMIYRGEPGGPEVFPILLYSWFRTQFVDFVSEPSINRANSGIRYVFPIAGITYLFHVSPNSIGNRLMPFTILPSGIISIIQIPPERGEEFFRNIHGVH